MRLGSGAVAKPAGEWVQRSRSRRLGSWFFFRWQWTAEGFSMCVCLKREAEAVTGNLFGRRRAETGTKVLSAVVVNVKFESKAERKMAEGRRQFC